VPPRFHHFVLIGFCYQLFVPQCPESLPNLYNPFKETLTDVAKIEITRDQYQQMLADLSR